MATAEAHAFGRRALAAAWPVVTGREASLAELQIAGAQAHLESGYGRAAYTNRQTGESRVINNWGAIQAGKPPCGPGGFEVTDTHADGTPYNFCYRVYATPEEGARPLVEHMTVKRPTSWRAMRAGDIDAWAQAMRTRDPESGAYGYFEQSAEGRAHGIELRVQEIAQALGEPVAAKRGGPMPEGGGGPGPSGGGGSGGFIAGLGAVITGALAALAYLLLRRR